jgi:transketolase
MLEDIALMRVLPNMVVIAPGDSLEAEKATLAMAADKRPNYIRLAREATPIITTEKTPFEIGMAYTYTEGRDLTVISTGTMTYHALAAAEKLFTEGIDIEVVHVPTIKPLDIVTILASVHKTKKVLTVEEHQVNGGLGGAIAELLGEEFPVPIKRMGVRDKFGQSGKPEELLEHYGLTAKHIMAQARKMVK